MGSTCSKNTLEGAYLYVVHIHGFMEEIIDYIFNSRFKQLYFSRINWQKFLHKIIFVEESKYLAQK